MMPPVLALAMPGGLSPLVFWGAVFLYAVFLYALANRLDHDLPWLAFVPVGNIWLLLTLGGVPWWLILAPLIPIPYVGGVVLMLAQGVAGMSIASQLGKPMWAGALLLVPGLNLLVLAWLAFSD